ncbi:MAG TPA: hypothetical protein VIF09_29610 [Polyangiaceae bacterium]|jgi:hypothetical protein
MRRVIALLAAGAIAWAAPSVAHAADAEQLQFAAHEHDLGYRAYVAKSFDEAATHFENAYFAAPNPAELRSAIRARREAGELARAATLASIGQRRHPGDAPLAKLTEETLAEAKPKVFEVHLTSPEDFNVAVDDKVALAEKGRDLRLYVEPGKHEMEVGWSDDRTKKVPLTATAGGSQTVALDPPPIPPRPVTPLPGSPVVPAAPPKPFGPLVFFVGAGLTAVGVGVTVFSGVDAQKNPGTAAVKADCVGQGTSCPEYQQGLDAQRRTNILLAATAGVGVVTAVVGVFFTQWSHPAAPATGFSVEPVFGPGQAALRGTF